MADSSGTSPLATLLELNGPEHPVKRVAAFLRHDAFMLRNSPSNRWDVPETMANAYENAARLLDEHLAAISHAPPAAPDDPQTGQCSGEHHIVDEGGFTGYEGPHDMMRCDCGRFTWGEIRKQLRKQRKKAQRAAPRGGTDPMMVNPNDDAESLRWQLQNALTTRVEDRAELSRLRAQLAQTEKDHAKEREELQPGRWRTFRNSCPRTFPNIPMAECSCVDCVEIRNAREVEAARELTRRDADFQEWAQSYLDGGRWAGHDRSDAIKTELLERDAALAQVTQERDRFRTALAMEPFYERWIEAASRANRAEAALAARVGERQEP